MYDGGLDVWVVGCSGAGREVMYMHDVVGEAERCGYGDRRGDAREGGCVG